MFSKSVDSIISNLTRVVVQLDDVVQSKDAEVNDLNDKANALLSDAAVAGKERDRARRISKKLEEILL